MNTGSSWYNNTTCDTIISLVEDVGIPNFGVVSRTDGIYGLGSKVSSRWQCRVSSLGLIGYRTLWPLQHFVERAFSDGKTRILSRVFCQHTFLSCVWQSPAVLQCSKALAAPSYLHLQDRCHMSTYFRRHVNSLMFKPFVLFSNHWTAESINFAFQIDPTNKSHNKPSKILCPHSRPP